MRKVITTITIGVGVVGLLYLMSRFNIHQITYVPIRTLYANLVIISRALYQLLPFIVILVLLVFLLRKKWVFRVERLSIGGFNILFENPNALFRKQLRTFLDTKRTLFSIDSQHDNFHETLESYYETYRFVRDEIKMLGDVKEQTRQERDGKPTGDGVRLYRLGNRMIRELNSFLTQHHSDFSRWYVYLEKYKTEDFHLKPIGELQKGYPRYEEICDGFTKINAFFSSEVAQEFNVNIDKWRAP